MITEGELYFFNSIKDDCEVIFDVGVQRDTYLVNMAPGKEFHLFEPNLDFHKDIINKLVSYPEHSKVFLNPFGLGDETGDKTYYPDSQSFFLRTHHFQSDPSKAIIFRIKDFKEYIKENNIEKIDFLKIDTEGGEPDILIPYAMWIRKNVKYIQFEYASTWFDRGVWTPPNLIDIDYLYGDLFNFYILYNFAHPISKEYKEMLTLIKDRDMMAVIDNYVNNQYGFEIAMVRK